MYVMSYNQFTLLFVDDFELTYRYNVPSYDITLEFSEALFGVEKEFMLSHLETCEVCAGTGAKIGTKMRICSTCGGRGQVMRTEQTPFGMFSQVFLSLTPGFLCFRIFIHYFS